MAAQDKMKELTATRRADGLLAYEGSACIGWIAIDPMTALAGHDCRTTGKDGEWSIHCLFIKDVHRGKGLSMQLIQAAIEYAKSKNAKLISAFPIPNENRSRFPPNEAEFSGRFSSYQKLGFQPVGQAEEFYKRMEYQL
jgi:GNAT superfamily N-acetyltransferase